MAQARSERRFGPRLPEIQVSRKSALLIGAAVFLTVASIAVAVPVAQYLRRPAVPAPVITASVPQFTAPAPISAEMLQHLAQITADGGAVLPIVTTVLPVLTQARNGPQGLPVPQPEIAPQPSQLAIVALPLQAVPQSEVSLATVEVLAPTLATPRPQPRRLVASAATSLPRPLPRPARPADAAVMASAVRPLPRPALAQASLASAAIAAAENPVAEDAVIVLAGFAPLTSPQPLARPAHATEAPQRVAAAAAPQPTTPALAASVAASEALAPETLASAPVSADCPSQLARAIPRRPRDARNGSEIATALGTGGGARDQLIARELLAGNMPSFLRALMPVTMSGKTAAGRQVQITVCVTPDYLALGDDADFVRVPMGLPEAAKIADKLGFMLPTTRIVDAIYAQAGLRLAPRPMQAGPQMSSTGYFRQHNATIDGQTSSAGFHRGELIAGTKKDLVLSNRLRSSPGQVAIYGWHQPNGKPIQPLSTVHEAHYSDYSHGVRLVSQTAYLNGKAVPLADLLEDPVYAWVISTEGPIPAPHTLLASLYTH